jgi:hypothetical protein
MCYDIAMCAVSRSSFERSTIRRQPRERRTSARRSGALALAFCLAAPVLAAQPRDPLERARILYNQRQFTDALSAAEEAALTPARADSANLIAARAYLERYRESASSKDLTNARDHLKKLNTAGFSPTERVEYVIGLGETLFFDGAPGAAAVIFGAVLAGPDFLTPAARDGLLDWWASAIDRDARRQPDIERRAMYQKILDRMEVEMGANPSSTAASYWLAAAAWGQLDLPVAWDAALAGWVRAGLSLDENADLRGDIDQLMLRGIIPDRAKATAQPADSLRAEWERFKERWTK